MKMKNEFLFYSPQGGEKIKRIVKEVKLPGIKLGVIFRDFTSAVKKGAGKGRNRTRLRTIKTNLIIHPGRTV